MTEEEFSKLQVNDIISAFPGVEFIITSIKAPSQYIVRRFEGNGRMTEANFPPGWTYVRNINHQVCI